MDGRDRGGLNLYLPRAAHLSESARGRHRIGSISAFRHAIPIILPARHHPVFHPVQDRTGLAFLFFPCLAYTNTRDSFRFYVRENLSRCCHDRVWPNSKRMQHSVVMTTPLVTL
jgi:hypothetical protein